MATCTRQNKAYLDDLKKGVGARVDCIYHGIDLDLEAGFLSRRDTFKNFSCWYAKAVYLSCKIVINCVQTDRDSFESCLREFLRIFG